MYGKLKKNLGFSLLPVAFFFLFEPGYATYDVLPDFIGYFIICLAIINLADLNNRVKDAFVLFRRALIISVLRYVAVYLLETYFLAEEHSVGTLLFAFVFAVAEIMTLLPAYKALFDGVLHLATLYDGSAPYMQKNKGGAHLTDKIHRLTVAFVILRAAAMVLPELTTLKTHSLYEFIILLRVFGILVVAPIGIIWLISWLGYCRKICQDRVFIDSLSQKYTQSLNDNPHIYTFRVISVGLSAMMIAFILSIDIYSNHINVIPDYVFYAALVLSAFILNKITRRSRLLCGAGIIGIAVSAFRAYTAQSFMENYYFSAISKDINAYYAYYTSFYAEIAESFTFVLALICAILVLNDIFSSHTDLSRDGKDVFKRELRIKFSAGKVLICVLAIFSAVGGIYYLLSQPYYYSAWYFYYSMIISVAFDIVFAFAAAIFLGFVKNSVEFRYQLYL